MSTFFKFIIVGSVLAGGFVDTAPATAGVALGTVRVRLRVTARCTIAATPITFANTASSAASAPANVIGGGSVTCSPGLPYDFTMTSANGGSLVNGATRISYRIMEGANQISATRPTPLSDTGTGVAQPILLSWQVTGWRASLPTGVYSDTVTLTVNW